MFKRICHCLFKYIPIKSFKKVDREKIENEEILVRTVLSSHLKKGKIKETDLYVDSRGDVSLNRSAFADEIKCKTLGLKIETLTEGRNRYIGFAIFKFTDFKDNIESHQQERPNFDANIVPTPLDENNSLRDPNEIVYVTDKGNPAHADLKYINPDQKPTENSPNTSMRVFSRELVKRSTIIYDNSDQQNWSLHTFEYYYNSNQKLFNKV